MEIKDTYDVKRVHIVNLILTAVIASMFIVQSIVINGFARSIFVLVGCIIILCISMANYFLPINQYFKGLFFSLFPAIVVVALVFLEGYGLNKHYIILLTLAMTALYFKKELIVIYTVVMNILFITSYIFVPDNLIGKGIGIYMFFTSLLLFNGAAVLLFFLCKWGREVIEVAAKKENEANLLVEKLAKTFASIGNSSFTLDENINQFNINIQNTKEASTAITMSVQEMAKSIQEEATSIYSSNETMTSSLVSVQESLVISKGITAKSEEMNKKVTESWHKIYDMSGQIGIVNKAIGTATVTVSDLIENIQKVNGLLDSIKQISSQTNLLALNAAIESARAGEHGKGFAVVSGEIRKLAEQSSQTVKEITSVTDVMFNKAEEAISTVTKGEIAANEGDKLVTEISEHFKSVIDNFELMNSEIAISMGKIEFVAGKFIEVQEEIGTLASISEENAAVTEEVLATVENTSSELIKISASVEALVSQSSQLKELAKQS